MREVFYYFMPRFAFVVITSYLLVAYIDEILQSVDTFFHGHRSMRQFVAPNWSVRQYLSCGKYVTPRDVIMTFSAPAIVYWVVSLFYVLLDWYVDVHQQLPLWKHHHVRYTARIDYGLYKRAIHMMMGINVVNFVTLVFISTPLVRLFRAAAMCDAPDLLPNPLLDIPGFLVRLVLVYILTDVVFYTTHRICHEVPFMYRHVHKVHHVFVETYGVCASACHPVEQILVNLNTVITPVVLLGLPYHWMTIWLCITVANTIGSHSGYSWGGKPIVASYTHDQHHKFQLCEYGINVICDRLFRTRYADMVARTAARTRREE